MANEGATKPTYSELVPGPYVQALESELARVRELLQRYGRHEEGCGYREALCSQPTCGETHVTPCTCGLGAESADIGKHSCAHELCDGHCDDPDCPKRKRADIGKLDAADKRIACCHSAPVRGCKVCMRNFPDLAGSAETGGEKAASVGKSLRKQWRSYRRRVKRAVLAQMPYREAGEWAADMLQITPLPTESKTKKFAVEFCNIAIKTYEHKEDAEAFQKELHRILRRKLRYYAAQEKRALMCKLAFKDRNPEPNSLRPSQNQTVSSGVEGAHEGTTADKSATQLPKEK